MGDKKTLVPRLRFPEFRDAGEWEEKKLAEIAEFYKGKGISKADIKPNGNQSCIRYGELYTIYGDLIDDVISKTDVSPNELFLSIAGDVIIPSSGETKIDIATAACVMRNNVALGSDLNVIRSKQNGVFLSYYLNGALKIEIAKGAQGDTVAHLYKSNLEKLGLAIPPLEEQQKIADCLSSLDALIAAQSEKIDALKTHKKGLMQQLFPRERETVPRLRFTEFRDAGEWEVKMFGELCHFVRGPFGGALKKDIFVSDGYAVYEQSHAIHGDLNSFRYFITENKYRELNRFAVHPGDIIMSCSGTMGKFSVLSENCKKGVINQALLKLTVKKDYRLDFVKFTLELPSNQEKLLSQSAGGAIKNVVGVGQMKEINLFMPAIPEEQQKIADCLSSLDALIAAQAKKLAALKTHKKGLMQQLFPIIGKGE